MTQKCNHIFVHHMTSEWIDDTHYIIVYQCVNCKAEQRQHLTLQETIIYECEDL